jgi:hypothetical protein
VVMFLYTSAQNLVAPLPLPKAQKVFNVVMGLHLFY